MRWWCFSGLQGKPSKRWQYIFGSCVFLRNYWSCLSKWNKRMIRIYTGLPRFPSADLCASTLHTLTRALQLPPGGKLLASRSAYRRMGSTGTSKAQPEVPGADGSSSRRHLSQRRISAMCIPLHTSYQAKMQHTPSWCPRTLTHVTSSKLRLKSRGRSLLHSGYDFGAPEETGLGNYASSQLTETHFQWVHASFPQRKVRFKHPSARDKCNLCWGQGVISIRGPHSSQTSKAPAICSDGLKRKAL